MSTFVSARRSACMHVAWFSLPFALAIACTPTKQAQDPSTTSGDQSATPKAEDDTPKWDSSSETAESTKSPKPHASSGSSGSSNTTSPAATQRRSDEYDKEATEMVLQRASRQVKANCGHAKDEDGNAKGPWGKASVSITLGHNGHAHAVSIAAPYDGKPTGKCAVQAFSNLMFPPWNGPDTTVDWPVEIDPPSK